MIPGGRLRRHLAGPGEWWWAPLVYALVVAWTYRALWHQHGAATGLGWDVVDTHAPDLEFMARELREGRFSLWNPWDKGGYAVYADPVVHRYYPFAWPFVAWGASFGVSWWLMQLEVLAHHVAAAACMHLFLRSRGLPVRAALIGGVGLVVSSPLLIHKASNILWPLAWVPLVWVALDAAIARPTWRRGAGVAAAFTLCATAGAPPGLFYAGLLIAPYALWRVAVVRPAWRPLVGCAVVAAALIAAVVAVGVAPTQSLVALGSRERWATGDAFALSLSMSWRGVFAGAFAHAVGYPEMYVGAAIVVLATCGAVAARADRGAPRLFVAIAIAGLVLAAGATLPVLPWLVHHVPGFAMLRVPGRYKLLAAWGLAAAAGYGAAGLATARGRTVAAIAAGWLAIDVAVVLASAAGKARPAWWSIAAMALACALVALAVWAPRLRRPAAWALVLVVLTDAPLFTHRPEAPPASDLRQRHERDDAMLARLDGVRDRFRLFDEFVLGERVGQRRGVRELRGYPAVDPLTQRRLVDLLEYAKREPAIVTDVNVRWVLQGPHFRFGSSMSFLPPLAGHAGFASRGGGLFEARHPAALAAWYGAVALVPGAPDARRALAAVRAQESPEGTRRRAVIEPDAFIDAPGALPLLFGEPGAQDGAVVRYEPDEIVVTVDAPRAGLVVLAELAFPGWTVEVDGAPAAWLRANYLLRGVPVGPGRHVVRWRFAPPRVRGLIAGYLGALAVMLAAAVWPRRRRPSAPSAPSAPPRPSASASAPPAPAPPVSQQPPSGSAPHAGTSSAGGAVTEGTSARTVPS